MTGVEVGTGKPIALTFPNSAALIQLASGLATGGRVEVSRTGRVHASSEPWTQFYEVYHCSQLSKVAQAAAGELVLGKPIGNVLDEVALRNVLSRVPRGQKLVPGLCQLPIVISAVCPAKSASAPAVVVGKVSGVGEEIGVKLWNVGKTPMLSALEDMERNVGALAIVLGLMKRGEAYRSPEVELAWELHVNTPHFPYILDDMSIMGRMLVAQVEQAGITLVKPATMVGVRKAMFVIGDKPLVMEEDRLQVPLRMSSMESKVLGEVMVEAEDVLQALYGATIAKMMGDNAGSVKNVLACEGEVVEALKQLYVAARVDVTAVKQEDGTTNHVITAVLADAA